MCSGDLVDENQHHEVGDIAAIFVITIQILEKVWYRYATDRVFCLPTLFSFLSKSVEHSGFSTEKSSCFSSAGIERLPLLI